MPTNGIADDILYSISKAPVYTYGMITATALVLAYLSFMDDNNGGEEKTEEKEEPKEKEEKKDDEKPDDFANLFAAEPEPPKEGAAESPGEPSPENSLAESVFGSLSENPRGENKTGGKSRKTKSKKPKKRRTKTKARRSK